MREYIKEYEAVENVARKFIEAIKSGKSEIMKDLNKKIKNTKAYYVEGEMEIINNEDTYKYNVKVSYKAKDYYKVSLKNQSNNHEQIILKNDDGVYVLTHKSTK